MGRLNRAIWAICTALQLSAMASANSAHLSEASIRAATYEVVVPKPEHESVTYDRPPPLELLPFSYRTDHYLPIGSAFAIAPGRYICAGHVLISAIQGAMGQALLRGPDGKIYPIDKITAFSLREDFVAFTATGAPNSSLTPRKQTARIGGTVYAVGNALGQGIIIRDGLLTSETPEERDGAWNWLRFSAATSPGNSGGPLLDDQGQVIGLILGKSPNENLNFALPIERILHVDPAHPGQIDIRQSYRLPVASAASVVSYRTDVALPKSYQDFALAVARVQNAFFDQAQQQYLTENGSQLFPRDAGSTKLLSTTYTEKLATIIDRQDDGNWDIPEPNPITTAELPDGGSMMYAKEAGWTVLQLRKPAQVKLHDLFVDSKQYMDLILKGLKLTRPVADQEVRVISLDRAQREDSFIDDYGRKWLLRVYPLQFIQMEVISIALAKPDGWVAMNIMTLPGLEHMYVNQGKLLANLVYTGYSGSLQEWSDFLEQKDLQPRTLAQLRISVTYDHSFEYASPRLKFKIDQSLQNIKRDSRLTLQFAYFRDKTDTVTWDVAGIKLSEDSQEKAYLELKRLTPPPPNAAPELSATWNNAVSRRGDYDGQSHVSQGGTWIADTVRRGSNAHQDEPPQVLYAMIYCVQQLQIDPQDMHAFQGILLKDLTLLE